MDKKEDLNIHVADARIKYDDFQYYIDTILNKGLVVPDSVSGILLGQGNEIKRSQRIIYFNSKPEEYFLIDFYGRPMIIERMFNVTLSSYAIYRQDDLSEEQIERIKKRFKMELLDKVVAFKKSKSQ